MTDEQLAAIRARAQIQRPSMMIMFSEPYTDRDALLSEVERLRAIGRRIVAALEPCEGAGESAWYHNGEDHGESIEGLFAELSAAVSPRVAD